MAKDLLEMFQLLSPEGSPIRMDDDKTRQLAVFVEEAVSIDQITTIIRVFLNRYPEEGLLRKAFQRLFELRQNRHLHAWERNLDNLLYALRQAKLTEWELLIHEKVCTYCPASESRFWDDQHPMPKPA